MPHPQHSSQRTGSANPKCLQFETPACKTSTYQKQYIIRATRVWNMLPKDLTINGMITLKEFRKMFMVKNTMASMGHHRCYIIIMKQH